MTEKEEDKNEKLKSYTERHTFWTTQALTQFGFSINFFLTIGVAMIAYLIPQKKNYLSIKFDCNSSIHWGLLFYIIAIILIAISILAGFISIISRLYDLRLTRHIIWVRKKALKKLDKFLPDEFTDLQNNNLLKNFWIILTGTNSLKQEFNLKNYEQIKLDFSTLRKQIELLGILSWKAHIVQIIVLITSIFIYGLALMFI